MTGLHGLKSALIGGVCALAIAGGASAKEFDIPAGDLATALDAYTKQTGADLIISGDSLRGTHTRGVKGDVTADVALARILDGTGFAARRTPNGAIGLVREAKSAAAKPEMLADAAPVHAAASVETVVVTSS
ncbi:MAG TPA: STN domain-containing protein, partial [Rhizomicrobium sp.]|nr:STN domain-containing protein [Rhizomicrobium sp.]